MNTYIVEEGGIGAGTVIRVRMKAFGQQHEYRARVTEPEPGRVLVETDYVNGTTTAFYVTPVAGDAQKSHVRFHTTLTKRPGIMGVQVDFSQSARSLAKGCY